MPVPDELHVLDALHEVIDPELGLSIVDLGLVYAVEISPDGDVRVQYTVTAPGCPMSSVIGSGIVQTIGRLPGVREVEADLVYSPPWNPELMSERAMESLWQSQH
jgi:metal-sulfur cluster biosynthetic enzyme